VTVLILGERGRGGGERFFSLREREREGGGRVGVEDYTHDAGMYIRFVVVRGVLRGRGIRMQPANVFMGARCGDRLGFIHTRACVDGRKVSNPIACVSASASVSAPACISTPP